MKTNTSTPEIDRATPRSFEQLGPQTCPLCKMLVEIDHTWCKLNGKIAHDYCVRTNYGGR